MALLDANVKTIQDCDAKDPRACTATERKSNGGEKAAPDAITLFDRVCPTRILTSNLRVN
jgi:hypothetical protein